MNVKLNYIMKTKTTNIPGYTAEASLFNVSTRYQATAEATVYGGIVQPASDVFFPNRPVPGLSFPFWGNCLKLVCTVHFVHGLPVRECRWVNAIC